MTINTILTNVGLQINDLLAVFSVLGGVILLLRPKAARPLYDWVMAAFVIGVAGQMNILLSGEKVTTIGAVLKLSPGVVNILFLLTAVLLVVIFIRRIREASTSQGVIDQKGPR